MYAKEIIAIATIATNPAHRTVNIVEPIEKKIRLTYFQSMFHFDTPENIRKPSGGIEVELAWKWVKL